MGGCCCTSSDPFGYGYIHRNIALCGNTGCGKSTIYRHIFWKLHHFGTQDPHATIQDDYIALWVLCYLCCGLITLFKTIASQNDRYFTHFHVLTRPHLHPTLDYNSSKLNQAYKAVVEFYYNLCESWDRDHQVYTIDRISLEELDPGYISVGNMADGVSYSFLDHLSYLWKNDEIQYAYEKYKHFYQAMNHLPYFMQRMNKLFATCAKIDDDRFDPKQCCATKEDFLKVYYGSTWIKATFIDSPLGFKRKTLEEHQLFDLGGRVGRRKRWIHAFANCEAVLFVVALDDYCKKSYV